MDHAQALVQTNRHLLRMAISVLALFIYYFLILMGCGAAGCADDIYADLNFLGQAALMVVAVHTSYRIAKDNIAAIWAPAAVFPLSTAVFFGFGNMAYFFASEQTFTYLSTHAYGITQEQLSRANLLTTLGVFSVLVGMCVVLHFRTNSSGRFRETTTAAVPIGTVAAIFLGSGLVLKYGIILPAEFALSERVIPGVIKSMAFLADIGFALVAYLAARGERKWMYVFWGLWPFYVALGMLQFSKLVVLFAILLPALGAFMGHRNPKRLFIWIAAAVLIYPVLQQVNDSGRLVVQLREAYGRNTPAGERVQIISDLVAGDFRIAEYVNRPIRSREEIQNWWLRLAYAGPQVRGMEQYDAGEGGAFFQSSLLAYFIPRFLWPDKPTMVSPGLIFHQSATGDPFATSRVGLTVYGDGYWQYGWLGTLLFSSITGLILGWISLRSIEQIMRRDFVYLPVIMLGLQMGALGPMGYLQNTILGGLPMYIGFTMMIALAKMFILPRRAADLRNALVEREQSPAGETGRG